MTEPQAPPDAVVEVPNGGWDARVRMFRAADEVDTFAVVTERFVIVVDTMSTPEMAAAIVARLASAMAGRQVLVVNTHAHYDHAWGNAVFATPGGAHPAPIVGHALAREWLLGEGARESLRTRRAADPRFATVQLVPPTITCTGGLELHGGDLTVALVPTPGHSPDHIALWLPEIRLLLAGDAAEHPFPQAESATSLPELRRSLERMQALDPAVVLPCHGGTTEPALLTRNRAYFDALEAHARAAMERGALPDDWAERDDLAELFGFLFAVAASQAGADPIALSDLYRDFHRANARATVGWLMHGEPAGEVSGKNASGM